DDPARLPLLLNGVGNDDAALRLVLALEAANDDAVVQGPKFHGSSFPVNARAGSRQGPEGAAGGFDLRPPCARLALDTRECQKLHVAARSLRGLCEPRRRTVQFRD